MKITKFEDLSGKGNSAFELKYFEEDGMKGVKVYNLNEALKIKTLFAVEKIETDSIDKFVKQLNHKYALTLSVAKKQITTIEELKAVARENNISFLLTREGTWLAVGAVEAVRIPFTQLGIGEIVL